MRTAYISAYLPFFLIPSAESLTTVQPVLRFRSVGCGAGLGGGVGLDSLFSDVLLDSLMQFTISDRVIFGDLTISNTVNCG